MPAQLPEEEFPPLGLPPEGGLLEPEEEEPEEEEDAGFVAPEHPRSTSAAIRATTDSTR
jgi:hypothetical protein